jgi:hypothetical protein
MQGWIPAFAKMTAKVSSRPYGVTVILANAGIHLHPFTFDHLTSLDCTRNLALRT